MAARADTADIDDWWDSGAAAALLRIVTLGYSTTVILALRWLTRHAASEEARINPVRTEPNRDQMATSLRVTGPVAFKTHLRTGSDPAAARRVMGTTLQGSVQRLTLAGSRETTQATISASSAIVGYRRVLNSAEPCAWCAMLASRGAVYTETSATRVVGRGGRPRGTRDLGTEYHDHCLCISEPLYRGEPEPPDVIALRDQWEASTAGLGGRDALNAFRRSRYRSRAEAAASTVNAQ